MRKDCKRAYKMTIESLKTSGKIEYQAFDDLKAISQHGFLYDSEHKDEYKKYSDYVKEIAYRQIKDDPDNADKWRGLYWQMVKVESFWYFESFLIYMEHKRPYEKQFYLPRAIRQKTVVDDLQKLADSKTQKMYTLSEPSRVGKELADDTPILTTNGWKNHGDLTVGDKVFNSKGEAVKVTYVHPKCMSTHIVTFSDGEEIECHANHEWIVYDRHKKRTVTIETREMLKNYMSHDGGKTRPRFGINVRQPIIGEHKELPIDPYTLGAWLGDGTNTTPNITNDKNDLAIVDKIVKNGYAITNTYIHRTYGTYRTNFANLRKPLQSVGMCFSHKTTTKHIPECYLTASIEQRLELLAGLIDTDGTLKVNENRYCFSTTEIQLARDFKALVDTFGWRTSVVEYEPRVSSSGVIGRKKVYRVDFNPTFEIPCVLERKQLHTFSKQRRITIVNIRESEKKTQGNCITVEGGEYLAGRSMKPTHNSTIMVFFMAWNILRHPFSHNALATHSNSLAKHFYKEILDFFESNDYCFKELFAFFQPKCKGMVNKSAEDLAIYFELEGDFPACCFRGCDSTWTGAIDITPDGYLFVDDLVRDRAHSLSQSRMDDTFADYLNKMVDRKNEGAKEIMIGTLWNVLDPIMRLKDMYGDNPDYVFRCIPALDENDESNFKYDVKGFSTEYYRDMRDKMIRAGNEPEWFAKFQQAPYRREGILFAADELRFFNGILPTDHKYHFITVCDVAMGGGDSVSMPIGLQDEDTNWIYVIDWFFNSAGVKITIPGVADMLMKYGIKEITFEKNNGGQLYAQQVHEELEKRGYVCSCNTKPAPNNISKEDKIKGYEGKIKSMVIFLDNTKHDKEKMLEEGITYYQRSAQYERAMAELSMFASIGKNLHDDAPDSIAQLCAKAFGDLNALAEVEVFSRAEIGF